MPYLLIRGAGAPPPPARSSPPDTIPLTHTRAHFWNVRFFIEHRGGQRPVRLMSRVDIFSSLFLYLEDAFYVFCTGHFVMVILEL